MSSVTAVKCALTERGLIARVRSEVAACEGCESFAELIVAWVRGERSLSVRRDGASPGKMLLHELRFAEVPVAHTVFDADHQIAEYPEYRPLRRDVIAQMNPERGLGGNRWIVERNARLKMRWVGEVGGYSVSPIAFGECVLAYALAPHGEVVVRAVEVESESRPYQGYEATLTIETPIQGGWREVVTTRADRYARFVLGRKARRREECSLIEAPRLRQRRARTVR